MGFAKRRAQALTRHFQQAKPGDSTYLHPCAIRLKRSTHAVFNFALIAIRCHINKVDDNKAAHVTQAQLPGDLIRGFKIGI